MLNEELQTKWQTILEHEDLAPIKDVHRRNVTAILLENTEKALIEEHGMLSEAPIPANFMGASSSTVVALGHSAMIFRMCLS